MSRNGHSMKTALVLTVFIIITGCGLLTGNGDDMSTGEDQWYAISGVVTDSLTGLPVDSAQVTGFKSNMMLSQFQFGVADALGLSTVFMIALQAVGAAAGNMIAIHNVVAASATVGLLDQEGQTLRRTIIPTLYYCLVAGIIGLVGMYGLQLIDPLMK